MSKIIENLFIGNEKTSKDPKYDFIINCTKNLPFYNPNENDRNYRIPINDCGNPQDIIDLISFLPETVLKIEDKLQENKKVLVHCKMGQQRSTTVVAAYLMWKSKISPKEAIDFIKSKKNDAFLYKANFQASLDYYYQFIKKQI